MEKLPSDIVAAMRRLKCEQCGMDLVADQHIYECFLRSCKQSGVDPFSICGACLANKNVAEIIVVHSPSVAQRMNKAAAERN